MASCQEFSLISNRLPTIWLFSVVFDFSVLLEFSNVKGRFPNIENKSQDWKDLLEMRDSLFENMQVDNDMLQDEFVG